MSDSNPVKEELLTLLADHNDFTRGNIPFAKLIKLYIRYEEQEKILFPDKKKTIIYKEFSLLCKKNSEWMLSYVRLTRLDPELLELINVRIGPFYLSTAIAALLCIHPRIVQRKMLERAQELSQGRQPWLWYYVDKLGDLYKKGDFASVPSAPVPYERPKPATSWPAEGSKVLSQSALPHNNSQTFLKIDTLDKKAKDDETFLKFLARTPTIKTRPVEPPPKEQPRMWQGDRQIIYGKGYRGSDSIAQEPD
jgi:hypothetical protein